LKLYNHTFSSTACSERTNAKAEKSAHRWSRDCRVIGSNSLSSMGEPFVDGGSSRILSR
jgi:hypothetical protein